MNAIKQLGMWYLKNCDGQWEHSHGVRIESLDNPGWELTVDLTHTPWAKLDVPRRTESRSDTDWVDYRVSDSRFLGYGGPLNLEEIIQAFLQLVSNDGPLSTTA